MSWGTELWDQLDTISSHTQKGINFTEHFAKFIKELTEIESDYASRLKKLWKSYQPRKREEEEYEFTCPRGFLNLTKEVNDLANQHDMISENLQTKVYKELIQMATDTKSERKKNIEDAMKYQKQLANQQEKLDKAKKKYERGYVDSVKAKESYERADNDINLSRADVEKAKVLSQQRSSQCEQCKAEYAAELEKTNAAQREHYQSQIPTVFQQLQDMDRKRILKWKELITQCATIHRDVIPIVNTCIDGMAKAADSIEPDRDLQLVINKNKSGFAQPGDIPFEDLGSGNQLGGSTGNVNNTSGGTPKANSNAKSHTIGNRNKPRKKTIFGIFGGNKGEEAKDDYSHLPPQQQKNELQKKVDSLRSTIAKETAERDGLIKMKDVYSKNSALGDPGSLDKQMEANAHKLDNLSQELKKFEQYLAQVSESLQQGGIQRRPSDRSQSSSNTGSLPSTPQQHRAENSNPSPDSRITSQESRDLNDSFDDDGDEVGECMVMYAFEGGNEGSLAVKPGEDMLVIEQDQGDGWTRVRRRDTGDEGFVPTTYISISKMY